MRFSEIQLFPDWLRYGILLFNSVILYIMLKSGVLVKPSLIIIFVVLLMVGVIFFWTLETELDQSNITIRIRPFLNRRYSYEAIQSWQVRNYKPILEYGGWGIRFGHNGTAYNVRGNHGLQLVLTNGKRILIGTQKQGELRRVMASILPEKEITT